MGCRGVEALDSLGFVTEILKHANQLRGVKQVVNLPGQVKELKFGFTDRSRCVTSNEFADANAIHIGRFVEVKEDLLFIAVQQIENDRTQLNVSGLRFELVHQINDNDVFVSTLYPLHRPRSQKEILFLPHSHAPKTHRLS